MYTASYTCVSYVFQGLCFAADAMEVLLLSFLSVILTVEWGLEGHQNDTLISVVFLGALMGTLILSPLGDSIGRRPVFSLTAAIIAFFGVGTAFCPNYATLLFARFMVGFGVGGLVVPFDTLAEFLPAEYRGPNLLVRVTTQSTHIDTVGCKDIEDSPPHFVDSTLNSSGQQVLFSYRFLLGCHWEMRMRVKMRLVPGDYFVSYVQFRVSCPPFLAFFWFQNRRVGS